MADTQVSHDDVREQTFINAIAENGTMLRAATQDSWDLLADTTTNMVQFGNTEAAELDPLKAMPDGEVTLSLSQAQELYKLVLTLTRGQKKLPSIREELLLVRDQAFYQRKLCESKEQFVHESEDALADALCGSENNAAVSSPVDVRRLQDQLRTDRADLRQQSEVRDDLERELNRLEYRVRDPEHIITSVAQTLVGVLERWNIPGITAVQTDEGSVMTEPISSQMGPADQGSLTMQFYNAVEEVSFLRQHLDQIELEHREARVQRIFREDQGESSPIPDEEFESAFQEEFATAENDYLEAIEKAKSAEALCHERGLTLEAHPSYTVERFAPDFPGLLPLGRASQANPMPQSMMDTALAGEPVTSTAPSGEVEFTHASTPDVEMPVDDADVAPKNERQRSSLTQKVEDWRRGTRPRQSDLYPLADVSSNVTNTPEFPHPSSCSRNMLRRRKTR